MQNMTKVQLLEVADRKGLKTTSKMTKEELVTLIKKSEKKATTSSTPKAGEY